MRAVDASFVEGGLYVFAGDGLAAAVALIEFALYEAVFNTDAGIEDEAFALPEAIFFGDFF